MAGVKLEFDDKQVQTALNDVGAAIEHPAPLFQQINEYLIRIHRARFRAQQAPDGTPWQPLSPRYLKRKHKNRDKILTLRGYLGNTLHGNVDDKGLEFGTIQPYGAIHQFGGAIQIAARSQRAYFRQHKNGEVGNRFVRKDKSNFAQWVTMKAHSITIAARPWLGTSEADNNHIVTIAREYLARAIS